MGGASPAPSSGAASRPCSLRSTLAASRPRRRPGLPSPGSATGCPRARSSASCRAAASRRSRSISACCTRLRELGVTVWNDARAIERCVDKSTTTFFLQRAGIPTPRTFARRRPRRGRSHRRRPARRGAEAGAEAAVRRARQRLAPDRLARRSRLARGGQRGLLSPGVHRAGAESTIRTGGCSSARAASSPP